VKVINEMQTMELRKINNYSSMKFKKAIESKTQAIANTRDLFRVRVTTLRPCLHHYEGFHYPLRDLSQRDYNLVYTRPEYTTPPTHPAQEVAQNQLRLQSSWWSNKNAYTLSYKFL